MPILEYNVILRPLANIDEIKALDTTPYADGVVVSTTTEGRIYELSKSSVRTADNYAVLEPSSGTGRWLLKSLLDNDGAIVIPADMDLGSNSIKNLADAIDDLDAVNLETLNDAISGISYGNLTEATSSVLTISGGTGAVHGAGTSISVTQADATHDGYLSSTDWTTFNSKQNALTFPLTIAQGGTNSDTALANNKVMISSGGKIVEASALPNGTTATTQSSGDNSTKVATTAYVDNATPNVVTPFKDIFTATAGQTIFSLAHTPAYLNYGILTLNGQAAESYTVVGTTLTWTGWSLPAGAVLIYWYAYDASATIVTSVFGRQGTVTAQAGDYSKSDVGLGNVDNTSDLDKPISSATASALSGKEPTLTKGNISGAANQVSISGGTGAVIGSGVTVSLETNLITKTHVCPADRNANYGNWRVDEVGGTGAARLPVSFPSDARVINSVKVMFFVSSGAAGASKNIDLTTEYCSVNNLYNQYTQSDTTSLYDFTGQADKMTSIDVTSLFSNAEANMCGTIYWDNKSIGGSLYMYGVVVNYTV